MAPSDPEGRMDGQGGAGGTQASERGKGKNLGLAVSKGPRACGQGGGVAMALAATGRGVWGGGTPPSPRGRLRRPGTPLGTWPFLWGPFLGMLFSQGSKLLSSRARQTQCPLWEASVCGERQGEGLHPPAWGAPTEEGRASALGALRRDRWGHVSGA